MNILVIMTCFNRKEKTEKCIKKLSNGNRNINFTFIVVDDKSKDGTVEMLQSLKTEYKIHIINGNGNLYYSRGMRLGMDYASNVLKKRYNYLLMVNDDVEFYDKCIENLINYSKNKENAVIVGPTCNKNNELTYGAIKYLKNKSVKYRKVDIFEAELNCDTFNANCVLIPYSYFLETGLIDSYYIHSLGDFDYGMLLRRKNYNIYTYSKYVGICENNSIKNTWQDRELSISKRIILKENPKGAPFKQWFYYLRKNFGIVQAIIYGISPYIKIIFKK